MDQFASASLVKALSRSYWRARWRIVERARCLHKYLLFDVCYCQSTRIQFDGGEFPVFRRLFPVAEQSIRECKAVNLSVLIETKETTGDDEGPFPWYRESFLASFFFLSAFIFHFSHLLSHSATCIFIANATSSTYFHSVKRMRMLNCINVE